MFLFLAACATIGTPDGGEKDVYAPRLIEQVPSNQSVNFTSTQMVFEFDEFFRLVQPNKQIIVSPPMYPAPEYKVKGKRLYIDIPDSLRPNTTYNIFFASAIRDVNEDNDTSFAYVFSTGSFVDSLTQAVWVKDGITGKQVPNVWIAAYSANQDSTIAFNKPEFLAKTNKSGAGVLYNLPNRALKYYALDDKNFNLMFDGGEDQVAFLGEAKLPSQEDLTLEIFQEEDTLVKILSKTYMHPGLLQFILNKEIDPRENFDLDQFNIPSARTNDTLTFSLKDEDAKKGNFTVKHTLNGKIDSSTIYINKEIKPSKVRPTVVGGSRFDHRNGIVVELPRTIVSLDTAGIVILQDSVVMNYSRIDVIERGDYNRIRISGDFEPNKSYTLKLAQKALIGKYGVEGDSVSYALVTYRAEYFGKIKLNCADAEGNVVQLYSGGTLIREVTGFNSLTFSNLHPGKYQLRLIIDANGDGKWTTGKLSENRQPEDVLHYPETIELRAGWDVDLDWIIPEE